MLTYFNQIYTGGDLKLADYSWSLKSWEGDLLATQYYMITSRGQAATKQRPTMGRYTICQNIVTPGRTPVYKHDRGNLYLYLNEFGEWSVGCWRHRLLPSPE